MMMILCLLAGCSETKTEETQSTEIQESTAVQTSVQGEWEYDLEMIDMTKWLYDEQNDVYYQTGISYCSYPLDEEYETLGIYVPGAYFKGNRNADGTYTCEIDPDAEINGYTAKLVNGTTDKIVASSDSSFNLIMTPTQISLYEITPNNPVDFSAISTPVYNDLAGYEWAEEAVENITKNKIANTKGEHIYAPGENITRGDFAMFFVRTLGLGAETTENFKDVSPTAEYAKEIAIGRALGILNGVGNDKYNPEAKITRQEMMTIISRAMKLSGEGADLSAYSDTGLIADYAVDHVRAMLASGLIKGNADGTINPLGNTTRAEAAVVMKRIMDAQ